MELFEAIGKRGSYRGEYTQAEIPKEDLEKIVCAGIRAPSGLNMQSTSFVVVTNAELREKISELMPSPATQTAPAILVVISEVIESQWGAFEVEDYGAAVENILLAMTGLGYAGVWMDGTTRSEGIDAKIKEMLELPEKFSVRTIIPIGVPKDEVKQREKKPMEERVFWKE